MYICNFLSQVCRLDFELDKKIEIIKSTHREAKRKLTKVSVSLVLLIFAYIILKNISWAFIDFCVFLEMPL